MTTETKTKPTGYSFLIQETDPTLVITPEDLTEEHRQFAETTEDFLQAEVDPFEERLEKLDRDLLSEMLKKAGEAGLFMIEIPEEYGGMGLDLLSQVVVTERMGRAGGFAVRLWRPDRYCDRADPVLRQRGTEKNSFRDSPRARLSAPTVSPNPGPARTPWRRRLAPN